AERHQDRPSPVHALDARRPAEVDGEPGEVNVGAPGQVMGIEQAYALVEMRDAIMEREELAIAPRERPAEPALHGEEGALRGAARRQDRHARARVDARELEPAATGFVHELVPAHGATLHIAAHSAKNWAAPN